MNAALSSRALGWVVGTVGVLALVGGVALGVRLGKAASRPGVEEIRVADPGGLAANAGNEALSAGGFSGFGGPPALEGEVLRRGTATEVSAGGLGLLDGAATSRIEFTQPLRLYQVTPSSAELVAGDSVVVKIADGRALAVLRVSSGTNPADQSAPP